MSVNLRFTRWRIHAGRDRPPSAPRQLLEAREQLANLLRYMDGKVAAEVD